jgi:hypothetical protein
MNVSQQGVVGMNSERRFAQRTDTTVIKTLANFVVGVNSGKTSIKLQVELAKHGVVRDWRSGGLSDVLINGRCDAAESHNFLGQIRMSSVLSDGLSSMILSIETLICSMIYAGLVIERMISEMTRL